MSLPNNGIVISKVRYPAPLWRYILLFQSLAQLQSWLITITLTLLLITGTLALTSSSSFDMEGISVGAAVGSLFSVIMVVPAEFDVLFNPDQAYKLLKVQFEEMGYVQVSSKDKATIYRSKLPRFLRWNEGNILISRYDDKVTVRGGVAIIMNIRRFCYKI